MCCWIDRVSHAFSHRTRSVYREKLVLFWSFAVLVMKPKASHYIALYLVCMYVHGGQRKLLRDSVLS